MLAFRVAKQLAPLQDTNVDEVTVRRLPEFCSSEQNIPVPSGSVISEISREVTAKQNHTPEMLLSRHLGLQGNIPDYSDILVAGKGVIAFSVEMVRPLEREPVGTCFGSQLGDQDNGNLASLDQRLDFSAFDSGGVWRRRGFPSKGRKLCS
jgi:hypothetical protein